VTIRMSRLFVLCCCFFALAACAGKTSPSGSTGQAQAPRLLPHMQPLKDISSIPQDLMPFAKAAGLDKALLDPAEQAAQDARANRIVFGPWGMARASLKKKAVAGMFGSPRGYTELGERWTKAEWDALRSNAHLETYPSLARKGITTAQTHLRELPTMRPSFSRPTPNVQADPFDNFQYSALHWGTPLFITHISKDRQWLLVDTPMATGWVPAADCAFVDDNFAASYQSGNYAAIISDDVPVQDGVLMRGTVDIGAFFPIARRSPEGFRLFVPVRGANGNATLRQVAFTQAQAAPKPMRITPRALATLGNVMMGQPYGWGGMLDGRDCSSTTRDLFTPFGLWLPRNSVWQKRTGESVPLEGLSANEKKQAIRHEGKPFLSLIWLPGHIAMYVGNKWGQPVMFHNMWGIRVVEQGNDDARHVVGRCAITTTEPGKELPNRKNNSLLIDRIGAFSTLPGNKQ
jgi:hypothetical protein